MSPSCVVAGGGMAGKYRKLADQIVIHREEYQKVG